MQASARLRSSPLGKSWPPTKEVKRRPIGSRGLCHTVYKVRRRYARNVASARLFGCQGSECGRRRRRRRLGVCAGGDRRTIGGVWLSTYERRPLQPRPASLPAGGHAASGHRRHSRRLELDQSGVWRARGLATTRGGGHADRHDDARTTN